MTWFLQTNIIDSERIALSVGISFPVEIRGPSLAQLKNDIK